MQHLDFGLKKELFTSFNEPSLNGDIILFPRDLERVLQKNEKRKRKSGSRRVSNGGTNGVGSKALDIDDIDIGDMGHRGEDGGIEATVSVGVEEEQEGKGRASSIGSSVGTADVDASEAASMALGSLLSPEMASAIVATRAEADKANFLLPTLRPPDLNYVQIAPLLSSKFKALDKTYHKRRQADEKRDAKVAHQLLAQLTLQPHTGRPCCGLLHFYRRIDQAGKEIMASLWFEDLLEQDPLQQINECYNYFLQV